MLMCHLKVGWGWWLTPVIPPLWRPRQADHLRLGVQDQPDQHVKPHLKKKKKIKKKVKKEISASRKHKLTF